MKLNGLHQLLVYADDNGMLGESVRIMKKEGEVLVVASKGNGIEENADKTEYVVMFRYQDAGRILIIKSDNISFERVEDFEYFGTI